MKSPKREIDMKLLTMKQVCEKVGYSRTQINRFWKEVEYASVGFPKPCKQLFKLLWSENEVDGWILAQLAKR